MMDRNIPFCQSANPVFMIQLDLSAPAVFYMALDCWSGRGIFKI